MIAEYESDIINHKLGFSFLSDIIHSMKKNIYTLLIVSVELQKNI